MESTSPFSDCRRVLPLILVLLFLQPWPTSAKLRVTPPKQSAEPSEQVLAQRIASLIRRTVDQSRVRLEDGTYATVMPVLPSKDALLEVKRYGSRAVKTLASYVNSTDPMEQHLSIRFLLQFRDDIALTAIQGFAQKSAHAGIRQEAIAALVGFPSTKVRPIVQRISEADTDSHVRAYAHKVLAKLASDEQQH